MAEIQLHGMPVWVYAKNIDNQSMVAPSQLVEGAMGENYQVEPADIDGFNFVKADGETSGIFDENMHKVTFYYRPDTYLEAQKLTDKYLHLHSDVDTYREFNGEPDGMKIWAGTVVKVASRIATKDGTFWYQLADSRWVPFSMRDMTLSNDDGKGDAANNGWQLHKAWEPKQVSQSGMVDFIPEKALRVYDRPYGEVIGEVANGTPVQIVETVEDDADNTWYHLDQYGWTSSIYIKTK